ncbi:hypothetical protein A4A49_22655 [Nicotiana attenuata]|uniref:Uncharacterized protein n=1 Tax=Nicotiana attenuata TaxID=49451 RepID=A0A1J6L9Y8_NICAT|nr:hypothetical protein A4A49_22655 [Nicotiana attenuata]
MSSTDLPLRKGSVFLSFSQYWPSTTRTAGNSIIAIIIHQRQVVCIFTFILMCGNTNARTPFQRREKRGGDAVDEPHGHPIKFSAAGSGGGPDPWLDGTWSETEETAAAGGGSCHDLDERE